MRSREGVAQRVGLAIAESGAPERIIGSHARGLERGGPPESCSVSRNPRAVAVPSGTNLDSLSGSAEDGTGPDPADGQKRGRRTFLGGLDRVRPHGSRAGTTRAARTRNADVI